MQTPYFSKPLMARVALAKEQGIITNDFEERAFSLASYTAEKIQNIKRKPLTEEEFLIIYRAAEEIIMTNSGMDLLDFQSLCQNRIKEINDLVEDADMDDKQAWQLRSLNTKRGMNIKDNSTNITRMMGTKK